MILFEEEKPKRTTLKLVYNWYEYDYIKRIKEKTGLSYHDIIRGALHEYIGIEYEIKSK